LLKKEKIQKFDKAIKKRTAYEFFERNEIEKIIDEGILVNRKKILEEVKKRWEMLSEREKKEFKNLEKKDEKRIKISKELKEEFERIKENFFNRFDKY